MGLNPPRWCFLLEPREKRLRRRLLPQRRPEGAHLQRAFLCYSLIASATDLVSWSTRLPGTDTPELQGRRRRSRRTEWLRRSGSNFRLGRRPFGAGHSHSCNLRRALWLFSRRILLCGLRTASSLGIRGSRAPGALACPVKPQDAGRLAVCA